MDFTGDLYDIERNCKNSCISGNGHVIAPSLVLRVAAFFYGSDRPGWGHLFGGVPGDVHFVKRFTSDTKCGIDW